MLSVLVGLVDVAQAQNTNTQSKDKAAISDNEYEKLRLWTLGYKGVPSAKWGDVNCSVWGEIYPDCKHTGVDYGTSGKQVDIKSVCYGKVIYTGGALGRVNIYNKTTDTTFIYMHLSEIYVENQDIVTADTVIGKTGRTAPSQMPIHLHFEARKGKQTYAAARYSDTINPYQAAAKHYNKK
jgi:murein DD-endopeptidase MepM/ murein hydrolase activator NlpD